MRTMLKDLVRMAFVVFGCMVSTMCLSQSEPSTGWNGVVLDATGKPVPGASVRVRNTERGAVTDNAGHFILTGVPPGDYTVDVTASGFVSASASVTIPSSAPETEIRLSPAGTALEPVLVTAEKKTEDSRQVAGSVAVFNGRDVDNYRLWQSKDLSGVVSNLNAANPGDGRNVISIRGITSTSYDPAVVTYIDGVSQFNLDTYIPQLFDVDKIEVLKGPQGTLYGRNAMGGVINITTKKPDESQHMDVSVAAGNKGLQRYTLAYRTPLVKGKLYFGIAGLYEGSDGFYQNDFYNNHFDKQHRIAGNAYLTYRINQAWSVTANVKKMDNRNDGAFPLSGSFSDAMENPFHLSQNAVGKMIDNTLDASLVIRHSGRGVSFTSQTAYQTNYRYYQHPVDGDFSPIDGVGVVNNYGRPWNKLNVWTQEFRLASAVGKPGPFSWAAGALLFAQDVPTKQGTHFGADAALVGSPDSNFTLISSTKAKNTGFAFYGQAEYRLAEHLFLAAGLRYDWQRSKSTIGGSYLPDGSDQAFETRSDTSGHTTFNAVSPMATLSWRPTADQSFYLSYRRGFRTGGLTPLASDPSQPPLYPYKAEFSGNGEAGWKQVFWHQRLSVDVAVFYSTVNHVQVPTLILPDAITITKNAGRLESRGFEVGLKAVPVSGLQLDYQFGYTRARYTEGKLSSNGNATDLDGHKQVFTPETTSLLALQYGRPFSASGHLGWFIRGEWQNTGKTYFDLGNQYAQGSYQMINASAGFTWNQNALLFWMRNVTDTRYVQYAYDFGAARLGDPRTLGVTLRVHLF